MIIGVPKEIKNNEYRVGIIPVGVETLVRTGHEVIIETKAGVGSGIEDEQYIRAGAKIAPRASDVYYVAQLVIKIKEPMEQEYGMLKAGQILFTYLHLAANRNLTDALIKRKVIAFAYETLQTPNGELPCLIPMSEVAGRMAPQEGARHTS